VNVDQIYQLGRDDAFADQFCSDVYETFLAMPFNNRGGYPETRIKELLDVVHLKANDLLAASETTTHHRTFSKLKRVDEGTGAALVITDEITRAILGCHFFFGDLTGCNFGVVLETGIALALKPNSRVLLFTQDDVSSMHFDLKVTNINKYSEDTLVEHLAKCLVAAAQVFEEESDLYIRQITARLTTDAISALNLYGRFWAVGQDVSKRPSLWEGSAAANSKRFQGDLGRVLFHVTARELLRHRLFWNQYVTNVRAGADWYGMHCTRLGWRVIDYIWKDDPKMRQHKEAPTGP
jgi:hypothetical protein